MQITSGIKFGVINEEEQINEQYSASLQTSAVSSLSFDAEATIKTTCTGSPGPEGGVGLYQWVVK